MRRFVLPVLLLAAACAASPDPAQTAAQPQPVQTAAAVSGPAAGKDDPNEIVCDDATPPTGSRLIIRRLCMTRAEREERARADREATAQVQASGAWNLQKGD